MNEYLKRLVIIPLIWCLWNTFTFFVAKWSISLHDISINLKHLCSELDHSKNISFHLSWNIHYFVGIYNFMAYQYKPRTLLHLPTVISQLVLVFAVSMNEPLAQMSCPANWSIKIISEKSVFMYPFIQFIHFMLWWLFWSL